MKAFFLIASLAAFAASGARAGWWDSIKGATKEAVRKQREKELKKKTKRSGTDAAVRGLEEDAVPAARGIETGRGGRGEGRDYESLEWLESLEVTDDEVDRFVKEGRLAS
jgi:hypothetical protein